MDGAAVLMVRISPILARVNVKTNGPANRCRVILSVEKDNLFKALLVLFDLPASFLEPSAKDLTTPGHFIAGVV